MHTLLIKTSVLEKDPWVAMSMFNAWQESKRKCYQWLEWQRVHQTSLWYRALWEEEQAVAGPDIYLWGFQKTWPEVDKLLELLPPARPHDAQVRSRGDVSPEHAVHLVWLIAYGL